MRCVTPPRMKTGLPTVKNGYTYWRAGKKVHVLLMYNGILHERHSNKRLGLIVTKKKDVA